MSEKSFIDVEGIKITDHGYTRLKQRNGWGKKTADRMVHKVYREGLRYKDIKGYVKIWLKKRHNSEESDCVVYGKNLYVFKDGNLVTTFHVPSRETVRDFCF